jgi:NADPH:quinone reductase-like Zn-dependent oxidoreductase
MEVCILIDILKFTWICRVAIDAHDGRRLISDRIGAYAEYVAVSTKMLVHKPKHLSWEEAAGVPEVSN